MFSKWPVDNMTITSLIDYFVDQVPKSWLYKYYEKRLEKGIRKKSPPNHLGIILDGTRRYSFLNDNDLNKAYRRSIKTFEDCLDWCIENGIKTITAYAFSGENWSRDSKDVSAVFDAIEDEGKRLIKSPKIHNNQVNIKVIGRTDQLPDSLIDLINESEKATQNYDQHYLNIALNYSGRKEIVDATKKMMNEAKEGRLEPESVDEDTFEKYLYSSHLPKEILDVDLVIRTSGEKRLSGFLLWQSAYSELVFVDVYWPEFRKIDFLRAIRLYQKRKRRFGN